MSETSSDEEEEGDLEPVDCDGTIDCDGPRLTCRNPLSKSLMASYMSKYPLFKNHQASEAVAALRRSGGSFDEETHDLISDWNSIHVLDEDK